MGEIFEGHPAIAKENKSTLDQGIKDLSLFFATIIGTIIYVIIGVKSKMVAQFLSEWPTKIQVFDPSWNIKRKIVSHSLLAILPINFCFMIYAGTHSFFIFQKIHTLHQALALAAFIFCSSGTTYIGLNICLIFHVSICEICSSYYQMIIAKIKRVKDSPNLLHMAGIQHQYVITGVEEFMKLFGLVEVLIFLQIILNTVGYLYQIPYITKMKAYDVTGLELDPEWRIVLYVIWFSGNLYPLFVICMSTDNVRKQVGIIDPIR